MYFKRGYFIVRLNLLWALVVGLVYHILARVFQQLPSFQRLSPESAREIELLDKINMEIHVLRIQVLRF